MSLYTLRKIEPRSIVMTDKEIETLPQFAQEIVHHQRKLEALCSAPVVNLREAQNALDRRTFLARAAHRMWTSADDNPMGPPRFMR